MRHALKIYTTINIAGDMKTTIDIVDAIFEETCEVARRDRTTLRERIQEGLRLVLERRLRKSRDCKLKPIPFGGGGLQPEFADGDWSRLRDEICRGHGT